MSTWQSIIEHVAKLLLSKKSHISRRPSDCSRDDLFDVIIVGSSLSGLTAAAFLSQLGLHVCVIEPSSSCGGIYGRVWFIFHLTSLKCIIIHANQFSRTISVTYDGHTESHVVYFDHSPFPIEKDFFSTHLDQSLTEIVDPVLFTPVSQTQILFCNQIPTSYPSSLIKECRKPFSESSTNCISISNSLQSDLTALFPTLEGKISLLFAEIQRVEREWEAFVKYASSTNLSYPSTTHSISYIESPFTPTHLPCKEPVRSSVFLLWPASLVDCPPSLQQPPLHSCHSQYSAHGRFVNGCFYW